MLIEYTVITSLIVLIFYLTISEEIKKKKIKDKVVTKCIRLINIKMVIASIAIFAFVCSVIIFSVHLFENYSFFIPNYTTKWYHLVNIAHIKEILVQVMQEEINVKKNTLIVLKLNNNLENLFFGTIWGLLGVIVLYLSIQKDVIFIDGIRYKRNIFKWSDLKGYEWKDIKKKRAIAGYIEYYNLVVLIPSEKYIKSQWIEGSEEHVININSKDYEKVDNVLKKNWDATHSVSAQDLVNKL